MLELIFGVLITWVGLLLYRQRKANNRLAAIEKSLLLISKTLDDDLAVHKNLVRSIMAPKNGTQVTVPASTFLEAYKRYIAALVATASAESSASLPVQDSGAKIALRASEDGEADWETNPPASIVDIINEIVAEEADKLSGAPDKKEHPVPVADCPACEHYGQHCGQIHLVNSFGHP